MSAIHSQPHQFLLLKISQTSINRSVNISGVIMGLCLPQSKQNEIKTYRHFGSGADTRCLRNGVSPFIISQNHRPNLLTHLYTYNYNVYILTTRCGLAHHSLHHGSNGCPASVGTNIHALYIWRSICFHFHRIVITVEPNDIHTSTGLIYCPCEAMRDSSFSCWSSASVRKLCSFGRLQQRMYTWFPR